MNFIENLFGISPDGGSGAFEFLLFALAIAGIVLVRARYKAKQNRIGTDSKRASPPDWPGDGAAS